MKLRTKLNLSFLFLFGLIVLLTALGSYFLYWLSSDSKAIIEDNFRSLNYMQNLNNGLDKVMSGLSAPMNPERNRQIDAALKTCESVINRQAANITEPGEKNLSDELSAQFSGLKQSVAEIIDKPRLDPSFYIDRIVPQITSLRNISFNIYAINEETVLRKNARAGRTAEKAVLYMAVFGLSGVLISLVFIMGTPSYLSKPLSKLNEGIRLIASKNYSHQLPVKGKDELAEIAVSFNQMAGRLLEYNRTNIELLLSEKKRIDAVINQMHEAIIGLDESLTVLFANNLARELLNLKEEDIKGKLIWTLAAQNDFVQSFADDFALGGLENLEPKPTRMIHKGKEKWYSREIIPVLLEQTDNNHKINIGFVVVLTDITVFSEKDRAKTHFIATVSHELKTPISSIIMSLKLLKDERAGKLSEGQLELVGSIKEDSDRLLKITGELLKMAQVETGNIQLDVNPIEPSRVVEVSVHALQQQAAAKNILIEPDLKTTRKVLCDPDKTTWVLINFLSNAIRYSPDHSTIHIEVSEADQDYLRFSVRDAGPGIEPRIQDRIFDKYYKGPGSGHSGTGLGLAISKEFIKAMGGEIGVESIPGEGSTFYFQLPSFHH